MWKAAKAVVRGKVTAFNTSIKKKESKIKELHLPMKSKKKKSKLRPKSLEGRKLKIKMEASETESCQMKKSTKFFDKHLASLNKKTVRTQIIRNER